jgi:prenylcysteine oxidase/farnesylcysteine lyase
MYLLYRYSFDLFRMRIAVGGAVRSFDAIYAALDDTNHDVTYFDNPMDVWDAVGLGGLARVSYHDLLDGIGLHRDKSLELSSSSGGEGGGHGGGGVVDDADAAGRWWHWDWRRYMPGMGCLRSELLTGITLNTYNQDLNQMNGFVGLVSYVPAGENVFSVRGGNHRLMESALRQARWTYGNSTCGGPTPRRRVRRRRSIVTTVVASEHSMELFEDDDDDGDDAAAATAAGSKKKRSLGEYDVVILAAPMQMCQVRFLVESPMGQDGAVLHDMPLGGIRENPDYVGDGDGDGAGGDGNGNDEHGRHSFAKSMPPSATIPYTSVVTTVVSNATFNSSHFGLPRDDDYGGGGMSIPRSILVSERGKALGLGGITTLTILDRDRGLIKTFSSQTLESDTMIELFGPDHVVEYVQVWGGKHGGATPSFGGGRNSESLPFLLYDGDRHWGRGGRGGIDADVGSGNGGGPALYYVNAIESAVAAIEISAIGAKATAKLVARRLGLIGPIRDVKDHEELRNCLGWYNT